MMERTNEAIGTLRTMVANAKGVPMSASCMINRAEALALIDKISGSVLEESAEATSVTQAREKELASAREKAARIVEEAQRLAGEMVRETPVHVEAVERAEAVTREAAEESEQIRREADSYVDGRIAELEAGLARTMTQIQTMRVRLAERSRLDQRFTEDVG